MSLPKRHRKRAAGASAVSLILHVLFLAAMVAGLRVVAPPVEDRPIEISLLRPAPIDPVTRPTPAPSRTPERVAPGPVVRPRPVLAAPSPATIPQAPAPSAPDAVNPGDIGGPQGLLPSLTARAGCDDPLSFHLNDQQRAACDQKLAERAHAAEPLALNFAKAKLAEFERQERCKKLYTRGGIPSSSSHDDSTGVMAGLGYNPSLRECGPKDR